MLMEKAYLNNPFKILRNGSYGISSGGIFLAEVSSGDIFSGIKNPHLVRVVAVGSGASLFSNKTFHWNSAPLSVVNDADNIQYREDEIRDEDFTTRILDKLSSAATCLVAGVEYSHGQQIYSDDPCEFCLCLDGEMFCWWQDCPPTLEGPCRDRMPFSPCSNGPHGSTTTKKFEGTSKTQTFPSKSAITIPTFVDYSITNVTEAQPTQLESQQFLGKCIVMGKEYKIGETLPHDTGNCVECICGNGGQVTCSPHECAPPGDDINDYRQPGPRPQFSETF